MPSPKQKTTNSDLADYYRNPEKYENEARQNVQQQEQSPIHGLTPAQKMLSDAAYERVRQNLVNSPDGAQPMQQQAPVPQDTTQMSPDIQAEYDRQMAAKAAALKAMSGNGPRGL